MRTTMKKYNFQRQNMRKVNIDNAIELLNQVTWEKKHFDMGLFTFVPEEQRQKTLKSMEAFTNTCGTTACLAGFAAILMGHGHAPSSGSLADYLNIDFNLAYDIATTPEWWGKPLIDDVTHAQAIKMLKQLITRACKAQGYELYFELEDAA